MINGMINGMVIDLDEFDRDLTSFSFASGHRSLQRWNFKGKSSLNRLISAIFRLVTVVGGFKHLDYVP